MSQVQNATLHNFVQPALFFGAAILAGRTIQNFPGASKGGLLLSATLGSGIALASQKCAAEDESAWQSFARVTASLALGTILAPYAAKALKGRADITMPAALRFGLMEGVIALGLSVISSLITSNDPHTQLRIIHVQYAKDLEAWENLEEKEVTDLVKQFYEADLPPLSLKNAHINVDAFNAYRDFPNMTANQLQWHVEMLVILVGYEDEDLFALNLALHAKALPMNWDQGISQDQVDYAQGKPACVDLLHAYFTAHPIEFYRLYEEAAVDIGEMFDGKAPILLTNLEPAAIKQLSKADLEYIIGKLNDRRDHLDQRAFSIGQKVALNVAAHANQINGVWIWPITEEVVGIVKADDDACRWFHYEFTQAPVAYAAIEEGLRGQLDVHFASKQLPPFASFEILLERTSVDKINDFSQPFTWDYRTCFGIDQDAWEALHQDKTTAFVNAFIRHNLSLLPLDDVVINFASILQPKLAGVDRLQKNSVEWLLALEAKQPFLGDGLPAALQEKFAQFG